MNFQIHTVKIVVAVPPDYVSVVRDAMCAAGAGQIGEYSYCTMCGHIVGSFLPSENANPFIGEPGKPEFAEEEKLEAICPAEKVKAVLAAIRKAHPYEEPGIDLYPLLDEADFD